MAIDYFRVCFHLLIAADWAGGRQSVDCTVAFNVNTAIRSVGCGSGFFCLTCRRMVAVRVDVIRTPNGERHRSQQQSAERHSYFEVACWGIPC